MKVAIVHYWLVAMRGGERVVEALCERYPEADLFTHVYDPAAMSETIRRHRVRTTFIQKLPAAKRAYRSYLPLMPLALEQLDLRGYDVVISSESGPAKGVVTDPRTLHLCYCHTPMRYIWDMYPDYYAAAGPVQRLFLPAVANYLRVWDVATAQRVDQFIANSRYVARRIKKVYGRDAVVVHPPVDVQRFRADMPREDYYLCVSHFVPYKRVDLVVEAFNLLGRPLVVAGTGPDWEKVRARAQSNVKLLGWRSDDEVRDLMQRCRAFVFAAEEEFGIAPVEAQAAGAPVIAYGRGGVTETVLPEETGLFFGEQTAHSLSEAVRAFERQSAGFRAERIRQNAERFSKERFQKEMGELVRREWERFTAT